MRSLLLLLALLGLCACPVNPVDDDDSGDDDDATEAIELPDPSTGDEGDRFWTPDSDHYTPEEAWPAGVLTETPFYLEALVPEGEDTAWYIFEAGASFTFDVELFDGNALIAEVHVHDGTGLVLGDLVEAEVTLTPNGNGQIVHVVFDAEAGSVYVIEIRVAEAGFF